VLLRKSTTDRIILQSYEYIYFLIVGRTVA
jgi:hypothetical protein